MPVVDPASDTGVFLWKNCATGSWNVQMTAASGFRIYSGVVAAEQPFLSVSPVSIEANDLLDFTSNPSSIDFELRIGAGFDDGFTFETVSGAALCFAVNAPTDAAVYFGGDAVELAAPFRLDDLGLCDANNP
jgi:hypothetical protein